MNLTEFILYSRKFKTYAKTSNTVDTKQVLRNLFVIWSINRFCSNWNLFRCWHIFPIHMVVDTHDLPNSHKHIHIEHSKTIDRKNTIHGNVNVDDKHNQTTIFSSHEKVRENWKLSRYEYSLQHMCRRGFEVQFKNKLKHDVEQWEAENISLIFTCHSVKKYNFKLSLWGVHTDNISLIYKLNNCLLISMTMISMII